MHQENINDLAVQFFSCLQNGFHHAVIIGGKGFGADDDIIKFAVLQCFADIGIGALILGGIDEIDAVSECVFYDFGTLIDGQSQLAGADGQNAKADDAHFDAGIA